MQNLPEFKPGLINIIHIIRKNCEIKHEEISKENGELAKALNELENTVEELLKKKNKENEENSGEFSGLKAQNEALKENQKALLDRMEDLEKENRSFRDGLTKLNDEKKGKLIPSNIIVVLLAKSCYFRSILSKRAAQSQVNQ